MVDEEESRTTKLLRLHKTGRVHGRANFDQLEETKENFFGSYHAMKHLIWEKGRAKWRDDMRKNIVKLNSVQEDRDFLREYADGFAEGMLARYDEVDEIHERMLRMPRCERLFHPDSQCQCTATHTVYDPPMKICIECLNSMKQEDVFSLNELATIKEIERT